MTETDNFECLMIGLPRTGKTTFLAALWHVVRSDEVSDSLRLDRREGDQEYLNLIAAQWLKCKALERTSGDQNKVDIRLRDPATGHLAWLRIPDMSGELYESLWETRTCLTSFAELVKEVNGCLLFVHPGKVVETVWIDDANATLSEWETEIPLEAEDENENENKTAGIVWEPRLAPTQVQMVEILQFLTEISKKQFSVVLVISAWDLVKEEVSPEQWLEMRLPLLWQFLTANSDLFHVTYMGVSAQGGEVTGENSVVDAILDQNVASRRIRICVSDEEGNDISQPIRWLMST